MINYIEKRRSRIAYKALSAFIAFTFIFTTILPPSYAQSIGMLNLPVPGTMIPSSPAFAPVLLKGMTVHPENPLRFDFIIDSGNTDFSHDEIKTESERLVKYFLASLTVPKEDLWVNLSPYEDDRIIPEALGKTELGRDMLAQDYILKQLTASLMYPEKELGKKFWNRVYKKAQEKFGTTEIPVNTFNKVWILPETATVYENEQTVYVVESKFKVMLDEDYQARETSHQSVKDKGDTKISSDIVREIILPEIEREVNEGKNFAPLRQIYHSLILAKWYKETIKNSLLSKVYVDQNKIAGVNVDDETIKDQIYNRYIAAYKKGVFNYIREDYDRLSNKMIPRKYFSGGIDRLTNFSMIRLTRVDNPGEIVSSSAGRNFKMRVKADPQRKQGSFSQAGSPIIVDKDENEAISRILDSLFPRVFLPSYFKKESLRIVTVPQLGSSIEVNTVKNEIKINTELLNFEPFLAMKIESALRHFLPDISEENDPGIKALLLAQYEISRFLSFKSKEKEGVVSAFKKGNRNEKNFGNFLESVVFKKEDGTYKNRLDDDIRKSLANFVSTHITTITNEESALKQISDVTLYDEASKVKVSVHMAMTPTYGLYQMKNNPETLEHGMTSVIRISGEELNRNLSDLGRAIADEVNTFGVDGISVKVYKGKQLHATVGPIVRGQYTKGSEEEQRKAVASEIKVMNFEEALGTLSRLKPFIIDYNFQKYWENAALGGVMINGQGEILVWGDSFNRQMDENLANQLTLMRREFSEKAEFQSKRDSGSEVHTTIGTIENYHLLSRDQKVTLAKKIKGKLVEIGDLGSMQVNEISFVHYGDRGLSKVQSEIKLSIGAKYGGMQLGALPADIMKKLLNKGTFNNPFVESISSPLSEITGARIFSLISDLNSRGVRPTVHGRDLLDFGNSETLIKHIQQYTVLKGSEDIRRILEWKLNITASKQFGAEVEPPLGLSKETVDDPIEAANTLYDAIFDQDKFLANSAKNPLNIVLFRRERGGQQLTNLLKTLENVSVKVIVSGIDDGEGWRDASRVFNATGIPTAGKTLLDLAQDDSVRGFLNSRIDDEKELSALIMGLKHPGPVVNLRSDNMNGIYQKGQSIVDPVDWRDKEKTRLRKLAEYLEEFHNMWKRKGNPFSLENMPLRSMILVGAAYLNAVDGRPQWQSAINEIGTLLNLKDGDQVILPTEERQHLIALRENGTVHFSEESLTHYKSKSAIVGMWLVKSNDQGFNIDNFIKDLKRKYSAVYRSLSDDDISVLQVIGEMTISKENIKQSTRKVAKSDIRGVVRAIGDLSSTQGENLIAITKQTADAIKSADVIVYSNVSLENNLAPVLIVPGIREAIEQATNALKINLGATKRDRSSDDNEVLLKLGYLYKYLKNEHGKLKSTLDSNVGQYVDYILDSYLRNEDEDRVFSDFEPVKEQTRGKVSTIAVKAQLDETEMFSTELREAIIALLGIKRAGFKVVDTEKHKGKLVLLDLSTDRQLWAKGQLGLFKEDSTVADVISKIKENWEEIRHQGGFVFDVDKTILPKGAQSVTNYKRLVYVFMRLLREGVKVAIISGNSKEEQMSRIVDAIKVQMKNDQRAMGNLTFYLNGGATKISFTNTGIDVAHTKYNIKHSMDKDVIEDTINKALEEFGLTNIPYLTPSEVKDKKTVRVEKRGEFKIADTEGIEKTMYGSLAIKPVSKLNNFAGDPRNAIIVSIYSYLGKTDIEEVIKKEEERGSNNEQIIRAIHQYIQSLDDEKKKGHFYIRPGGGTTIDITNSNAQKDVALEDFVTTISESLTVDSEKNKENFYYFGDEFFENGNDDPIKEYLEEGNIFAVNDELKPVTQKAIHIGRSPQATLEFLEEILIKPAEVTSGTKLREKIDQSSSAIERDALTSEAQRKDQLVSSLTQYLELSGLENLVLEKTGGSIGLFLPKEGIFDSDSLERIYQELPETNRKFSEITSTQSESSSFELFLRKTGEDISTTDSSRLKINEDYYIEVKPTRVDTPKLDESLREQIKFSTVLNALTNKEEKLEAFARFLGEENKKYFAAIRAVRVQYGKENKGNDAIVVMIKNKDEKGKEIIESVFDKFKDDFAKELGTDEDVDVVLGKLKAGIDRFIDLNDLFVEIINKNVEDGTWGYDEALKLLYLQQIRVGVVSEGIVEAIKNKTEAVEMLRQSWPTYNLGFQFNPERAKRTATGITAPGETILSESFIKEWFPLQRWVLFKGNAQYRIQANPFPHLRNSINMVHVESAPQVPTFKSIADVFGLLTLANPESGNERFRMFLNAAYADFTIPHLHYQGFFQRTYLEEALTPDTLEEVVTDKNKVTYSIPKEGAYWMPSVLVVQGGDKNAVTQAIISVLERANPEAQAKGRNPLELFPDSKFTYNILFTYDGSVYQAYIFVKNLEASNPDDPTNKLEVNVVVKENDDVLFNGRPATIEMTDSLIYGHPSLRDTYDKVVTDKAKQQKVIEGISKNASYKEFDQLINKIRLDVVKRDGEQFNSTVDNENALANFVNKKNEKKEGNTRTIKFDLFELVSDFVDGRTTHKFSGYGLTTLVMVKDGNELERDYIDILKEIEYGYDENGIPYRDGIVPGNSYNERISEKEVNKKINQYGTPEQRNFNEFDEAKRYFSEELDRQVNIQTVKVVNSSSKITFGMAVVEKEGVKEIIVENAFLEKIDAHEKQAYNALVRAFVYALNGGTHEQNRIIEYEYARRVFPDLGNKLRVNVEKVYTELVLNNLESDESVEGERMAKEIKRKMKESLWELGVHMMNGDLELQRVRWSEGDRKFTPEDKDSGDVRIGFVATMGFPVHVGHLEPAFRMMAQYKYAETGLFLHGEDYRKTDGSAQVFEKRRTSMKGYVALTGGLIKYSTFLDGSTADGETKAERFIQENGGRKGKLVVGYLAGGDHAHAVAPDFKDREGKTFKYLKDGDKPRRDVKVKWDGIRANNKEFMANNNIEAVVNFNNREFFQMLPLEIEVDELKEAISEGKITFLDHANLIDTSGTNIRNMFASGRRTPIAYLPKIVSEYIVSDGKYRGWIIKLPDAISRLADKNTVAGKDDIELLKNWMRMENENNNIPKAGVMAENFGSDNNPITDKNVERALAATKKSEQPSSPLGSNNDLGGINMNAIEVDRQGIGVDIQFDPVQLQNILEQGVDGFAPIIIDLVPIPSILPLLGLGPAEKEEEGRQISRIDPYLSRDPADREDELEMPVLN